QGYEGPAGRHSEPPAQIDVARRKREPQVPDRDDVARDGARGDEEDGDAAGHGEASDHGEDGADGPARADVRAEPGFLGGGSDGGLVLERARRYEGADADADGNGAATDEPPTGDVGVPRPGFLDLGHDRRQLGQRGRGRTLRRMVVGRLLAREQRLELADEVLDGLAVGCVRLVAEERAVEVERALV